MSPHIKPTVRESTTRQKVVLLAIVVLSLYPFVLATASPDPFVLGLPWWYWTTLGVLAAIYLLSAYLVLDVRDTTHAEVIEDGR